MFGVGLPELAVIVVVAIIVFGPDRLPEFARQAGRMVRQVKRFADSARNDVRAELGPEFADFELTDLDPRQAMRKYVRDMWDEDDTEALRSTSGRPLESGERPPYDADAT
ncbi:MAG: sec-independent translocase [Nocardioidaceae bacterium]